MAQQFWASTKKKATKKKKKGDSWKYSSYWLGSFKNDGYTSIFEEDKQTAKTKGSTSKYDIFRLAEVRQAIANFVRILTQDSTISVKFAESGNSKTDGKTVVLSPDLASDEFDVGVGLALHEASHIVHSDFSIAQDLSHRDTDTYGRKAKVLFDFINIVEDMYIDAVTYRNAQGYRGYYQALYNKFFNSPDIDKALYTKKFSDETWDNYFIHVVNIRNPKRNLKALNGLQEIWRMIDLPKIERLEKPTDRYVLACAIYDLVEKYVAKDNAQQQDGNAQNGQIEFTDGGDVVSTGADGDGDSDSNGEAVEYVEMSKTAMERAEKLFSKQKDLVNRTMKKKTITKFDATSLNNIEKMDADIRVVMQDDGNCALKDGVRVVIIKNVTSDMVANGEAKDIGLYPLTADSYYFQRNTKRVQRGIIDGKLLAKRIQVRNEERITKSTRLETGKIDRRLISELGFENYKIFSNLNIKTYKPVHIHVSIDQSGSMQGNRFDGSMQLATMLATASTMINNLHVVVSLRSTFGSGVSDVPYLATIFDSTKHKLAQIHNVFPYCSAHGTTPEGLTFEAIEREIKRTAMTNDAYFINICDGEPSCCVRGKGGSFNYSGYTARQHCRKQMQMMEKHGVKYIAYYLSSGYNGDSDYGYDRVNDCYPNHVVKLKDPSEIDIIAKSLNKRLLEEYNPA